MENICSYHLYPQPTDKLKDNELMGYIYSGVFTYGKFVFDQDNGQVKVYSGRKLIATFKVNKDSAFRELNYFLDYFKKTKLVTPAIGVSYHHILFYFMGDEGEIIGRFEIEVYDSVMMTFMKPTHFNYNLEKSGIIDLFTRFPCQSNQWDNNVITMNGRHWFISFTERNTDKWAVQIYPDSKGLETMVMINKYIMDDDKDAIEKIKIKFHENQSKYF